MLAILQLRRWCLVSLLTLSACALTGGRAPRSPTALANPLPVQAANEDVLWERTVDVLHDYHFTMEREDRVARVMETKPRVGSNILEVWNHDSVGLANRMESSFQSIRRRVVVTFIPGDTPGLCYVSVEAIKEKERAVNQGANSAGGATFLPGRPLQADLDPVVGETATPGWIAMGRDTALESAIVASLQTAYSR